MKPCVLVSKRSNLLHLSDFVKLGVKVPIVQMPNFACVKNSVVNFCFSVAVVYFKMATAVLDRLAISNS